MTIEKVEPLRIFQAEYSSKNNKDSFDKIKEDFYNDLKDKEGFFIWLPSYAQNPRPEHMKYYGRVFSFKDGADGLYPAMDYGCRCGMLEVVDDKKGFANQFVNVIQDLNKIGSISLVDNAKKNLTKYATKKELLPAGYRAFVDVARSGSIAARQKKAFDKVTFNGKQYLRLKYTLSREKEYIGSGMLKIPIELYSIDKKKTVTKYFYVGDNRVTSKFARTSYLESDNLADLLYKNKERLVLPKNHKKDSLEDILVFAKNGLYVAYEDFDLLRKFIEANFKKYRILSIGGL